MRILLQLLSCSGQKDAAQELPQGVPVSGSPANAASAASGKSIN